MFHPEPGLSAEENNVFHARILVDNVMQPVRDATHDVVTIRAIGCNNARNYDEAEDAAISAVLPPDGLGALEADYSPAAIELSSNFPPPPASPPLPDGLASKHP